MYTVQYSNPGVLNYEIYHFKIKTDKLKCTVSTLECPHLYLVGFCLLTSIPHISPAIINIRDTSVHIIINIIFSYTVLSSTYSCDRRSVNAFFPRQYSKVVFSHEFRPLFLTSTFGASLVGCRLLAAGHQDGGEGGQSGVLQAASCRSLPYLNTMGARSEIFLAGQAIGSIAVFQLPITTWKMQLFRQSGSSNCLSYLIHIHNPGNCPSYLIGLPARANSPATCMLTIHYIKYLLLLFFTHELISFFMLLPVSVTCSCSSYTISSYHFWLPVPTSCSCFFTLNTCFIKPHLIS